MKSNSTIYDCCLQNSVPIARSVELCMGSSCTCQVLWQSPGE